MIRQIKPDEWPLLKKMRLAALAEDPYAYSETFEEMQLLPDLQWQQWASCNSEGKNSTCIFAFAHENPIGMAVGYLNIEDESIAYLVSMWISPQYRGTKAAPALVDAVEIWARSARAHTLVAGVTKGNDRAIAFYQKLGFKMMEHALYHSPAISGCEVVLIKKIKTDKNTHAN